jgi:hypothetical protein
MKPKVLFLCTGNSARLAVQAMREIGIDISQQLSKDVVTLLGQHIAQRKMATSAMVSRAICTGNEDSWAWIVSRG